MFRKDLEKLVRERVPGLWFHTLEKATPRSVTTLARQMRDAWALTLEDGSVANHDIHFAVCALAPAILFSTRLTLGTDLQSRLESAFESGFAGWSLHGPGAADWPPAPTTAPATRAQTSPRDRTGFEKWLIYAPTVGPHTLLHFNRQGDSYRLREFTTDLNGTPTCRTFLASNPDSGEPVDSAEVFVRLFAPELRVDVYDEKTPVSNAEFWASKIAELNRQEALG